MRHQGHEAAEYVNAEYGTVDHVFEFLRVVAFQAVGSYLDEEARIGHAEAPADGFPQLIHRRAQQGLSNIEETISWPHDELQDGQ